MKRAIATLAIGLIGCLALASPAGAATHHKSITKAQAAKQYLADVAPENAAADAASTQPSATIPEEVTALAPVIAADTKFASLLSHQQWPSGIKADIKTLVVTVYKELGDEKALSSQTALTLASWSTSITADGNGSTAAANVVRKDLGLVLTTTGNSPKSPLPLGTSASLNGFTVKVISVSPEAIEPNYMGDPSPDGNNDAVPAGYVAETYVVQDTNTGTAPASVPLSGSFLATNHLVYNSATPRPGGYSECYANAPAVPYNNQVYPGGTTTDGGCVLVPTAEATGLVMVIGEQYQPGGIKYFATS
jgi:hypothetical protein